MKRPSRAPKKPILVTTPIRTPGIQGQVYIRSSCARHLYNATHVLEYANVMGTQLGFEFLAELLEDEQKYRVDSVGNSVQGDTVLEEGRTWKHVGWPYPLLIQTNGQSCWINDFMCQHRRRPALSMSEPAQFVNNRGD
jgi:hypothetical protein